jgi:T-complex protein 1 subunit beta
LTQDKQHFAELAVEAVLRLKGSTNLSYIQVIKKLGGSIKDSFLCDGLIVEKTISTGCKRFLKNCKVLTSNTPMDYDKVKIYGTRVRVESLEKVQ